MVCKFPHDFPMISPWFPPFYPDHILQRWPSANIGHAAANWSATTGRVTESPARMTHGNSGNTWKLEDSWMVLLLWYDNIILQLFMHMIFLLSHCTWYDILQCNVVNLLILLENIISPVNITNQLLLIWCSLYWKFTHNTEYHIYTIYIVYYSNKFIYWTYHVLSYTMNIFCIWYSLLIHYAFIIIYQTVREQTVLYVISIKHYIFSW